MYLVETENQKSRPEEIPEETLEKISEEITTKAAEETSEKTTKEGSDKIPEGITEGTPEQASEESAEKSAEAAGTIPEETTGKTSEVITEISSRDEETVREATMSSEKTPEPAPEATEAVKEQVPEERESILTEKERKDAPSTKSEARTPDITEATTDSPQSAATAKLSKNVYMEMAKEETTLLKSALAVSSENCNRLLEDQTKKIQSLTAMNDSLVKRIKEVVFTQLSNYHGETVKSVKSLQDTLSGENRNLASELKSSVEKLREENGNLTKDFKSSVEKLKEDNASLTDDLKSCVDRLEKRLTDSIGNMEKKTDEAIQSLKERTEEVSKVYREITETSLEEVKTARTELKEELRRQPETKKETADLLRTNIESVSKDLSGYFRQELSGSVSELNTSLKKAREAADETEAKVRRGGRFSRVMRAAAPIVFFACCIISIIGLFV